MTTNKIESVDELKAHLYLAMQLEHATIPPYLTALYSIKHGTNIDAVKVLRVIAVEEMLHLTIAANLMNAIGGTPDLTLKGFVPSYPAYLPDGETDFEVGLAAFNKDSLATFMQIERPGAVIEHGKLVHRRYHPEATAIAAAPGHAEMHYYSIGDFYFAIEQGFRHLEKQAQARGETIFIGDPKRQMTSEYYYSGGGELHAVVDLSSALEGMRLIMEQGEGDGGGIYDNDRELAHYFRFEELSLGRYYQPGDIAGSPTGPTFTVDWDGAYPIKPNLKMAEIPADSALYKAALSFNEQYAEFLKMLTDAFNGQPQLLLEAVPRMFEFRNLMGELIRNPLPGGGGLHAMPTFEIDGAMAELAAATKMVDA
jgi:hypothetical protein